MEIEGKIIFDLGVQSGTSKSGNPWKKKEYVLETFGQYPKKVKFTVFGDRSDTLVFTPGDSVRISVDVESRQWQDKWFTDVNCYASSPITQPAAVQPGQPQFAPEPAAPAQPFGQASATTTFEPAPADESDDLPF